MPRAVIVGAGLSGCVLAMYLARRGYSVDVFEQRIDDRTTEGAPSALNITLSERGLTALEAVGAKATVLELAAPMRSCRVHVGGGVLLRPTGSENATIYSIAQRVLNNALLGLAEAHRDVRFHFGKRCVGVNPAKPTARFENVQSRMRSEVHANLIFGADGSFSVMRQEFQKSAGFNFSQNYWRCGSYKSLVVPAVSEGKGILDPEALHIWPRGERMLVGSPNRNGSFSLSLLLPFTGKDSHESLSSEAEMEAYLRENFSDLADVIPSLAAQFPATPVNPLLTIRCDPWSFAGRALLIGDAAHAILPSFGQGANAAFEDCAVLDQCLTDHEPDFATALRAFEQRRRPGLDVKADLSVRQFAELCEPVADPKFLRNELEHQLHNLYPELYLPLYSMLNFSDMP